MKYISCYNTSCYAIKIYQKYIIIYKLKSVLVSHQPRLLVNPAPMISDHTSNNKKNTAPQQESLDVYLTGTKKRGNKSILTGKDYSGSKSSSFTP